VDYSDVREHVRQRRYWIRELEGDLLQGLRLRVQRAFAEQQVD
jgi:hypothetical protein